MCGDSAALLAVTRTRPGIVADRPRYSRSNAHSWLSRSARGELTAPFGVKRALMVAAGTRGELTALFGVKRALMVAAERAWRVDRAIRGQTHIHRPVGDAWQIDSASHRHADTCS
jgi:hypothetical protein